MPERTCSQCCSSSPAHGATGVSRAGRLPLRGTNTFHGSAFYFLQDASYTKKDYFVEKNNLNKPDTRFQQLGGTLGGPLIHNKLHFFGSLERVLNDRASTISKEPAEIDRHR